MKIVVINGTGGSGKDTFVEFCCEYYGEEFFQHCMNISTVDYVKEIAEYCGWKGEKDPASRRFLSQLKDALTEWKDIPFKSVQQGIAWFKSNIEHLGEKHMDNSVVFIHCREPKEIARLVEEYNAVTLLIRREAAENVKQINHADNEVLNYEYTYVVDNNGTLAELKEKAFKFMEVDLAVRAE